MIPLKSQVKLLTSSAGVYLFKDSNGVVIYVGKAVHIKKRVESYFRVKGHSLKTELLVDHIHTIETIPTFSEAEALILEASLIKQYQPKYNVQLKDGKTYPFIQITREEFPLVSLVRLNTRKYRQIPAHFYGPYVNPALIREALGIIRKIFPFRTCEPFADKPCLDFHLGLCEAPCANHLSGQGVSDAKPLSLPGKAGLRIPGISQKEYASNIRHVRLILEGKRDDLMRDLQRHMEECSQKKNFEEAAKVRDQIRAIGALYSGTKDVNYFKEAEQLQRALGIEKQIHRIECFDNSNTLGGQSVGAMVSFLHGLPDKANYRRFKIKTVEGIDDVAMMAEIVRRRYTRLKEENRLLPDLIVVDGGKGQLNAAVEELRKLNLDIPIISLAKREEEIFVPQKRNPLKLSHDSLGLKLLQRLRDEAHRFGLSYHRLLRSKNVYRRG